MLKKVNFSILLVSFIMLNSSFAYAQNEPRVNTENQIAQDSVVTDSVAPKVNTFKVIFNGKPGRAALYSLVIPSGGQIYNRKWWKVPLALGIDGWFTYNLINTKNTYNEFDKIVVDYQNGISHPRYSQSQAVNIRQQVRGNVEMAWVYLVLGHLVTVFDAYVDRHLMDFDISTDLGYSPMQNGVSNPNFYGSVSFKYNFSK